MSVRRLAALGLAALLLSACAGPGQPLEVAFKEFPSDIVLGAPAPAKPPIASVPPVPLQTVFETVSGSITGGASSFEDQMTGATLPRSVTTRLPCSSADPFAVPAVPAANTITALPGPGTYTYRNSGSFKLGGPTTSEGLYPDEATRTIESKVTKSTSRVDGAVSYSFDVTATLADTITTTTYEIHPESPARPQTAPTPGLYVSNEVTKGRDGQVRSSFRPSPAMLLLPFPAVPGFTFDVVATDGSSVMTYRGTVGQNTRVDACGVVLDAVTVHLDGDVSQRQCAADTCVDPDLGRGTQIRPDGRTDFVADYSIVPQYGGVIVADKVVVDATEDGAATHRENQATINREPRPTAAFP